jgi:hypothetical protein
MSVVLPEDTEPVPLNARSKLSDAPPAAKIDTPPPVNVVETPPVVKTPARATVVLEEDTAIPPTGLFISANGRPYLLMPGVEAQVPQEVVSVLNDAVTSMPVIDPQTQRVTGYRSRLRFPYRRING